MSQASELEPVVIWILNHPNAPPSDVRRRCRVSAEVAEKARELARSHRDPVNDWLRRPWLPAARRPR